jgi:hypothetical protein
MQPDDNVGMLATMFAQEWVKQTAAPSDAGFAFEGLAEEYFQVVCGTDSEFAGEGLAGLWQQTAPFWDAGRSADFNPSDEDFLTWADYLRRFVSLPAQHKTVETASDYELMRARRLMRFAIGCLRRFNPSIDCRDDIESPGGWCLMALGPLVVPILIALLRRDSIRHKIVSFLLDGAKRLRRNDWRLPEFEAMAEGAPPDA